MLEYGTLIGNHGSLVRRRWILGKTEVDAPLLHADELGPVADALALDQATRNMHIVPISKFLLLAIAIPALIPITVLFSIQVPIKDVLLKIVNIII